MTGNKRPLGGDLAKVDATTDEDIARQIAEDPDTAPELTEEWFDQAEVWHGNRYLGHARDFENGKRKVGRPKGSGTKELVTLRLDREILDHFRAGGPGWQTRLNDALRAATPTSAEKVRAQLKEDFSARPAQGGSVSAKWELEIGSSGQVSRSGRPLPGPTIARPAAAREGQQPRRARSPSTS
jgi:uncharacterized protein (DUF4415 family)